MQKCILFSLIVICAIISAGCVVGSGTVPATTSAIPAETTGTPTAATTTPPVSMASLTEIRYGTVPPTIAITTAPMKPMAAAATLQGKAGVDSESFTVQAPGEISINWHYWASYGEVTTGNCRETKGTARANLVGKSIDVSLFTCGASSACKETKTFNIITPGTYSIEVDGCNGWRAVVDNA